jgi:hypothetical protein
MCALAKAYCKRNLRIARVECNSVSANENISSITIFTLLSPLAAGHDSLKEIFCLACL